MSRSLTSQCVLSLRLYVLVSCLINLIGILPRPRICNFIDSLISWVHLFTESYSADIDNIVPFGNTTPVNQNKMVKIKERREG